MTRRLTSIVAGLSVVACTSHHTVCECPLVLPADTLATAIADPESPEMPNVRVDLVGARHWPRMLLLSLVTTPGHGQEHWQTTDSVALPALGPTTAVFMGICTTPTDSYGLYGLADTAPSTNGHWRASRAWRPNPHTGRFDAVSPDSVPCHRILPGLAE